MPFAKDDPRTKEAARRGGRTGLKHFSTLTEDQHRLLSRQAGKLSGESRRLQAKRKK
jgi:hypothetical protein